MSAGERWTAEEWDTTPGGMVDYRVTAGDAFVAYISVPPGDEGRSTVAKMVAALQMEGR